MSKIRVYELARELKIESKLLVNKLKELGIEVASHQSTLTADQLTKIRKEMGAEITKGLPKSSPSVIRRRREGPEEGQQTSSGSDTLDAEEPIPPTHVEQEQVQEDEHPRLAIAEEAAPESLPEPDNSVQASDEPQDAVLAQDQLVGVESSIPASEESSTKEKAAPPRQVASAAVLKSSTQEPQKSSQTIETKVPMQPQSAGAERNMARPQDGYESAKIVRREPGVPSPVVPRPTSGPGISVSPIRRPMADDGEPRRTISPVRIGGGGAPAAGTGRPSGFPSSRPAHDRGEVASSMPGRRVGEMSRKPPELDVAVDLVGGKGAWRGEDGLKGKDKEKDKKRSFLNLESDEPVLKKLQKAKRDQVNMRSLLNQVDSLDEEALDVELPEVPEVEDRTKRTVYTPQVAAGRKKDIKRRKDLKKTQLTTPRASYRVVKMGHEITVGELAKQLAVKSTDLIKKLMGQGVMATINQGVDLDTATLIAGEYGFEVKSNLVSIEDILVEKRKAQESAEMVERPPIVTIMGHVDHGKTSILDAIRKAKVAASEAGGITQHIGAYTVEKDGRQIAFLDTPGHEAFSAMRARGAKATDIVVLVVAADDGVMPQTVEAIAHARASNVPIIVAINKIDKPNKNFDRIYAELNQHGIQSEEWGGQDQFVKVSALQGLGIEELLDAILLQAEILELKAPVGVPASGVVVEAHLDKGRGPVATIMVQKGLLKVGDFVVAGTTLGRVRAMHDHTGKRVKEAGPSTPVEVVGLSEVPMAGDLVDAVEDEKTGKEVSDWRKDAELRKAQSRSSAASLDQLLAKVKAADTPEVPIIVKADTQGSLEAISEAVLKLNSDRVRNRIVHKAVGGITESDMALAATSGAVVVGFNVRAARGLDDASEKQGVLIKYFSVIYDIVDALKSIMAGRLPPIQKEVIQGHAEVRQTIRVPKFGTVAGTSVLDGKVTRNSQLRLIRNDVVIYSGKIGSLRRFKDDVREVLQGYECGIGIEGYSDIREGDVIETFIIEEHAPAL